MTELEKHKKLNFLFYKIFQELYQGKINPISLGEVGKITDILVSSIFCKSNNENYDLNSDLKEEDLDLLENEILVLKKLIFEKNKEVSNWMKEQRKKVLNCEEVKLIIDEV
tara:strand:- start:56 stop:388 length:333 start_codon:yes stop_codon:yes gene_type:complete